MSRYQKSSTASPMTTPPTSSTPITTSRMISTGPTALASHALCLDLLPDPPYAARERRFAEH